MSVIDNPVAELERRMNDYKNYPAAHQGETYASRRRRLEGAIDNEIRRAGGDPYARDPRVHDQQLDGGRAGLTEPGAGEKQTEKLADAEVAKADRRERLEEVIREEETQIAASDQLHPVGHPPALPHPSEVAPEIEAHRLAAGSAPITSPASGTSPIASNPTPTPETVPETTAAVLDNPPVAGGEPVTGAQVRSEVEEEQLAREEAARTGERIDTGEATQFQTDESKLTPGEQLLREEITRAESPAPSEAAAVKSVDETERREL